MAKTTAYLSSQDIELIQNKIVSFFGENTSEIITLNIIDLIQELDYIINKVELIQIKNSGKYRIKRSSKEKRRLMAEAYLIIFKVREFLLNEEIDYRYYYNINLDGISSAKVIGFSEDNILNYIKFGREGLKIADNILKTQEEDQEYQALLDQHFNNLLNGVQKVSGGFHVVHSFIMEKYGDINEGLRKKNGQYQVFTMGHIYEAIDIAFSEAIENNQTNNYNLIESYTYGKYLNYDSVAGTKGGDNAITMTQIKANAADILDYTTILKDLKILQNIFNPNIDKNKIKENIKRLYLDASKYKDINDFNNALDIAVNKVTESFQQIANKT